MGHWPSFPDVTLQVREVIESSRSYKALKEAVVTRIALDRGQQIRQSLHRVELRNREPSELPRETRRLTGVPFRDDMMLRELWLQWLPPHLLHLLSATRKYLLGETAKIANGIMQVSQH